MDKKDYFYLREKKKRNKINSNHIYFFNFFKLQIFLNFSIFLERVFGGSTINVEIIGKSQ